MGPAELLAELNRRGVEIAVEGDRLRFRPREAVTPDLRAELVEHKADLLCLLGDDRREVGWRVEAMRGQVPRTGTIPFLVARHDVADAPGRCLSCGNPLDEGRRFRCGPCVRAVERVLNDARERA